MQKYAAVFSVSWQNGLVYRTSLILWRLRQVLASLMALTVWTTAYSQAAPSLSYSQDQMITYIFLTGLLQSIVLATALQGLTGFIYSGQLSYWLTKPINIFGFLASQDLADKLKNLFFIVLESVGLYLLFRPVLAWPTSGIAVVFGLFVLGGILLNFFISLIFGAVGFWSPDSWGPRFLFYTLIMFTSGTLFPLDILPPAIVTIMYLTPLPFLSFVQTQLFLGRLTDQAVLTSGLALLFWIIMLAIVAARLWRRGIKDYTAMGN